MNTNLTILILNEPTLNGLIGRKGLCGFDSRCAHAHT
nr:MAG TPA: PHD-type domain-containing protein [Caudoviricetes sp.]DAZ63480.1 MAG TPA: PHD-type domain-containing protein [Caudoviricetes sp.]